MSTELDQETRDRNEKLSYCLRTGQHKTAAESLEAFTRTMLRERGIQRRLAPYVNITKDDLDRQYGKNVIVKLFEREPNSEGSVTMAFASKPATFWIRSEMWPVQLFLRRTPRYTVDVLQLITWDSDLRAIINDNQLKDLEAAEDTDYINTINQALGGVADQPVTWSGEPQWVTMPTGIDRDSFFDGQKPMMKTPASFAPISGLMNQITWLEFLKTRRDEFGGDGSEDILQNGIKTSKHWNMDWTVTIKRKLVPDGTIFYFGDMSTACRALSMVEPTMWVEKQETMIVYGTWELNGLGFGTTAGLSRIDYQPA